jgi:branched-chain amino acid transport system substrate-binding protein
MKRFRLLFLLLAFLFPLLSVPCEADDTIKIGLTLGLTGKYAEMSNMQMKGFKLWESDVNKKGGILGKKVQVIIYDDKSDPLSAKSLYEQLIVKDAVDFVFGPYSSEITEAVLPVTEKYGYPMLVSGASADRLWQKDYKNIFGVLMIASKYAVGFLEMLVKEDISHIAIVYADDAFSVSIADGTKKWAERFGLSVVLFEGFKKGTKDLSEIVAKVRTSKAQVLIVCGHLDESIDMKNSLKKADWHPRIYYASVGPALQKFYDKLRDDVNFTFSSSHWEPYTKFPNSVEFTDSFLSAYKIMPSYHAAIAYASGEILATAIKKAMSMDKDKIRDILSSMDTMTIIGRYGVNKAGVQIRHFNLVIQWQKGKKEIVWPKELRTAKPIFK